MVKIDVAGNRTILDHHSKNIVTRIVYSKGLDALRIRTSKSLTDEDHSIEGDEDCLIVYINHASQKGPNARFTVVKTAHGRVIYVSSKKAIRRGGGNHGILRVGVSKRELLSVPTKLA